MMDMRLTTMQAEHNSNVATAVIAVIGTNTPVGDCACDASTAVITITRGGRPAAVLPTMGTASVAAAHAKSAANAKKVKSLVDPLNVVVLNPDYNKVRWDTHKAHCGPMTKVIDDCRETIPPTPPRYSDMAVNLPPSYDIKVVCNWQCGRASNHKPHTSDKDAPLMNWAVVAIPILGGGHCLGKLRDSSLIILRASCSLYFVAGLPCTIEVP